MILDEIYNRPEMQSRVAWFYSASEDGYANYGTVCEYLEQLRPYIKSEKDELKCELADLIINSDSIYILNTQDERIKYNELINKIKEANEAVQTERSRCSGNVR